jgi:hypothetical protein
MNSIEALDYAIQHLVCEQAKLPPPASKYEVAVRKAAALLKQLHGLRLEQAQILADHLEAADDADDVEAALAELKVEVGGPLHWHLWLEETEEAGDQGPRR